MSLWAWTKFSISDSKLTAASLAILADVLKACWARVRARLKEMALLVKSSTRAITAKSVVVPVAPVATAAGGESSEESELDELLVFFFFSAFLFFFSALLATPLPEARFGAPLGETRRGEAAADTAAFGGGGLLYLGAATGGAPPDLAVVARGGSLGSAGRREPSTRLPSRL